MRRCIQRKGRQRTRRSRRPYSGNHYHYDSTGLRIIKNPGRSRSETDKLEEASAQETSLNDLFNGEKNIRVTYCKRPISTEQQCEFDVELDQASPCDLNDVYD